MGPLIKSIHRVKTFQEGCVMYFEEARIVVQLNISPDGRRCWIPIGDPEPYTDDDLAPYLPARVLGVVLV